MRVQHVLFGLLAGIALLGCGGSLTSRGIAQLRAISAVSNPSRIDVFTDFSVVASDLSTGEGASYSNQTATALAVGVRQFGNATTIASTTVNPDVDEKFTVVPYQSGASAVSILVLDDNYSTPDAGSFKLRLAHVDRLVGNVDVYVVDPGTDLNDANPVLANVVFANSTSYIQLTAGGTKEFIVTLAGTTTTVGPTITLTPPSQSVRTLMLFDNSGTAGLNVYND